MSQCGAFLNTTFPPGTVVQFLEGNVGGPVGPDGANTIFVVGGNDIIVTGNPGTNTLTIDLDANIADTFTTDAGNAIPIAQVLNILGADGIATSGAGNTVTVGTNGTLADTFNGDVGSATPVLGILSIAGGTNIETSAAGSTVTINATQTPLINNYTDVAASPYVVLATDYYLSVDCSGGPIIVQLPDAPTTFRTFIIKDRTGNANLNTISVTTVTGVVTIDGVTTYSMNTQYSAINLLFNGVSYEIY